MSYRFNRWISGLFRCTITQTPPPHCYGSKPGAQARAENCCDDCPYDRTCNPAVPLHSHRLGMRIGYMHFPRIGNRWGWPFHDVLLIDHPHIIEMLAAGYSPQECKQWQLENDAAAVPLHAATVTCFCGASMSTVNAREFTCPKNCCTITRTGRC